MFRDIKTCVLKTLSLNLMKKRIYTFAILNLLVLSLVFSGCSKEKDPAADIRLATITEAVTATSSFNVLTAALKRAKLETDLNGAGPLTLFGPTDAAFQTYLGEADEAATIAKVNQLDANVLANILKYHVVAKQLKSNEMTAGSVAALNGKSFTVNLTGGVKIVGAGNAGTAANVTQADVVLSNGIIHVIDRVLIPN
jgi:uncharacterized surface protein with fasciclin (FAS1) repeats